MNTITTKQIDEYFATNYNALFEYSKKIIFKYNRKYDPSEPITEAYLNVLNCLSQNKIQEYYQIEQFTKSTIFYKISQSNSNLNKVQKVYKSLDDNDKYYNDDQYINETIIDFDIELQLEFLYSEFKTKLNKTDKRIFEIVFEKNINTAKTLAEYLNISISSAYSTLKNINDKLKLYIKNTK